ncbi:hypothetical protein K469DRAFT_588473, partial [Zopfia rhizophila CBS 207.26]
YGGNEEWISKYYQLLEGLLDVYIFADKYSVDELRDDVITATYGYCAAYDWYPDPEVSLITKSYEHLPPCSKFTQFLLHVASFLWKPTRCSPVAIEAAKDLPPDFVFDLMIMQSERLDTEGPMDF